MTTESAKKSNASLEKELTREAQGTSLREFPEEPRLGTAQDKTPITLEPSSKNTMAWG